MPKQISKLKIPKHPMVWEGPSSEGPNGGISQSMLAKFLQCRERFRIKYVLGLKPADQFSRAMEYGNIWHLAEQHFANGENWKAPIKAYCDALKKKYITSQPEIQKWYNVCLHQFPIYIDYWKKHKDVKARTAIFQEEVFDVPYELPSGKVVRLRGKFDGADLIGKGKNSAIYLFETKSMGEVVEAELKQRLTRDLQTMMYLITLEQWLKSNPHYNGDLKPINGVRFNVIRRPLSGGRGTIKQLEGSKNRKPETETEYYTRLQQYFIDDPAYWFFRWTVEVSQRDIENFKNQFFNPLLESLCEWYEYISMNPKDVFNPMYCTGIHWIHPYGVSNRIDEGYTTEYDAYLEAGNEVGLRYVDSLFGELK